MGIIFLPKAEKACCIQFSWLFHFASADQLVKYVKNIIPERISMFTYTVCSVLADQSDVLQLLSEVSKMTQYTFDHLVMWEDKQCSV